MIPTRVRSTDIYSSIWVKDTRLSAYDSNKNYSDDTWAWIKGSWTAQSDPDGPEQLRCNAFKQDALRFLDDNFWKNYIIQGKIARRLVRRGDSSKRKRSASTDDFWDKVSDRGSDSPVIPRRGWASFDDVKDDIMKKENAYSSSARDQGATQLETPDASPTSKQLWVGFGQDKKRMRTPSQEQTLFVGPDEDIDADDGGDDETEEVEDEADDKEALALVREQHRQEVIKKGNR